MPAVIRSYANNNQPIITEKNGTLHRTYFNLVRLGRGEEYQAVERFETLYACCRGTWISK